MMRHCRQCRADAVGLLGEDRSAEFTSDRVESMDVVYDLEKRREYQASVESGRQAKVEARKVAMARLSDASPELKLLVAVATQGNGRINEHFGHAHEFQIFEVSAAGTRFVGHRRVDLYCQGGYGDDEALPSVVKAINDCHAVFVARIGACPREELKAAGIEPVDRFAHEFIEPSTLEYFRDYAARVRSGEITHVARGGDAVIRQGAYVAA